MSESQTNCGRDDRGLGRQPVFSSVGKQPAKEMHTTTIFDGSTQPIMHEKAPMDNMYGSTPPEPASSSSSNWHPTPTPTVQQMSPDMSFGVTIPAIPNNDPGNPRSWASLNPENAGMQENHLPVGMQSQLAAWPHGVKVSPPPVLDTSKYVAWKKNSTSGGNYMDFCRTDTS